MRICIDDWEFAVDMTATMAYSAGEAEEHCSCAYCRNFYAAIDSAYPQLRPFLTQFGVDVEAPDELIPYEPPTQMVAFYGVSGKIMRTGSKPLSAGNLCIYPETAETAQVNTFLSEVYFFLRTDMMQLPWVLDEPMEDVISPANEPSFLKSSIDKFLSFFGKSNFET